MAVFTLTLVGSMLIGSGLWLVVGSPMKMSEVGRQNDVLNLLAFAAGVAPVMFVLVFFGIGGSWNLV